MTFWFWMTPIMIAEEQVPARFQWVLHANPVAYVVKAYRASLVLYRPPDTGQLLILAGWALAAFILGGLFFRHLKRGFADVL